MKNNLFTSSVIALTLLLNGSIASQAQSTSTCQNTINTIKNEIVKKGAKAVHINGGRGDVRDRRNPTNRTDSIWFMLDASDGSGSMENYNARFSEQSFHRINNILNSRNLMNYWATMIVKDCNDMAIVAFCPAQSDCIASFVASPEGKAIYRRQASNCDNYNNISWYEECYN